MTLQGWKHELLGNCVRIRSGVAPSDLHLISEGQIPYLKVEDLNTSAKYLNESRTHTNDHHRSLVPAGTVIFPKRGAAIMNNKIRINLVDCYLDSNLMSLESTKALLSEYLFYLLQNEQLFKIADTSTIPQINNKHIEPYKVLLPPLQEQDRIVLLFRTWDAAIEKAERLIAAKECRYTHELSRLISLGHHTRSHVGTFAHEVSVRNSAGNEARVLSVTNSRGFVLPEEQFERRVASADLSNYKVVRRGQYAYNPSRINVGSIARLDGWDDGVLSPMYVVFGVDETKVNSDYFLHWLDSHEARERIKNSAQGSVRETVSFTEFAAISIPLPNPDKQAAIARYLSELRKEISTLGIYARKMRTQKRGLMQKLLTGQWRVQVPETPQP